MNEQQVVLHQGVYKKIATVPEAIFMITGLTIGAGVLGVPYVVAQVGLFIGILYILFLGLAMLSLNLMIGEIAVRTKEPSQLPGFAGKYLGGWAKKILSITIVFTGIGALLAYIVGEGETLAIVFGGDKIIWSAVFWSIAGFFVWQGLQTAKKAEKIVSFTVIAIICGLSIYLLPKVETVNFFHSNLSKIFLPYGVILFALNATPAVVAAHALLPGSQRHFRKAVIIGTLIPIVVYILFALATVGVNGLETTEVATIGLGKKLGDGVLVIGNIFASLAMFSCFIGMGIALKQTLVWDHKVRSWLAGLFVISAPLFLFLLGIRNFVAILDIVGGLFIGIEAVLMILVCYMARKKSDLDASRYGLNNFWLLAIPVLLIFSFATVYSIIKLIIK